MISLFETDAAGAAQERVLARARLILSAATLAALYVDPTKPAEFAAAAHGLLMSYVIASLLYLLALPHLENKRRWVAAVAHGFDIVWLALLTSMTGASSSPLFVFFTFVVLAAAFRWGYMETLATTLVILWVLVAEGVFLSQQNFIGGATFELNWFLVRITYMAIAGVLLAYLASHQKQLRLESALVARILSRLRSETTLDAALETAGRELLHAFGARSISVAVRVTSGATLHWRLQGDSEELPRSVLSQAEGDAYLSDAPSAFILKRRRRRAFLTATLRGKVTAVASHVSPDQPFTTALVCSASYPEWFGRVFVFDPVRRIGNVAGLRLLGRVTEAIAPSLHAIFLIGRLRSRSEASERARLARELHDTSIQSLIGLEMEVLALSRRTPDSTLRASISSIHSRLLYEIRALRNLMAHLGRSAPAASPITERLTEMLAGFQVDSGIRTRLVSSAAIAVPSKVGQEILRLVEAALSNVRRHSGATQVDVGLERHGDGWRLVIEDDGQGFRAGRDPGRVPAVAPWSMRERVAELGGELVVERRKSAGVRVEITLPSFVLSA